MAGIQSEGPITADGPATFASVVLTDLARSADVLTAIAREAEQVYQVGAKGFRPRSPALRAQRDRAMATTVAAMQRMAEAWRDSGLVGNGAMPNWLTAAQEDMRGKG